MSFLIVGMAKCEVKFDNNPNGIFYSGQTLSGVVELTNEKSRKIRGLSLRIEGFAKVRILSRVTTQRSTY